MNTNDKLRELIRSPLSADNTSAAGVTQADHDAAMAMLNHAFRNAPDDCTDGVDLDDIAQAFARHRQASIAQYEGGRGQHVAYFDEGEFHWMSGIKPRNCELYTHPPTTRPAALAEDRNAVLEEAARAMESLAFFTDVDELRTMTKQEMSVRTCHEGAAAIRALRSTEAPAQGCE